VSLAEPSRCIVAAVAAVTAALLAAQIGCGPHPAAPAAAAPAAPAVTFTDVTARAGIQFHHFNGARGRKWLPETMGSGCAFLDYDNDGWLDILLVNGNSSLGGAQPSQASGSGAATLHLYRNNHDGTFTDVSAKTGMNVSLYGMGVAVGDYDNDGWDDLFITCVGRSRLFHNVAGAGGGRRFVDVTAQCGIVDRGFATSCAWLDYDRDGRLDLFVCHYVVWSPARDSFYSVDGVHKSYARPQSYTAESCRLYHNLGGGRFADVTAKAGILNARSKALGVAVSDYDGDGWPDIFVANDTEPNFLYHNQGDGTFKEVGVVAGLALSEQGTSRAGMGIDTADLRHTGAFDVLITNFAGEQLTLYHRDASGIFLDVAAQSGVGIATQTYLGFGAFFVDYDLDGWQDLFINNGHINDDIASRDAGVSYAEPALLFRNVGAGRFVDVSARSGAALTTPRVGRGAAWGDFDNDGSPDLLLMANNGPAALLHNDNRTGNGWIRLRLVGTTSNTDAYGARVQVKIGGDTQTQEVRSGSSYLSASDRRLLFGLGAAARADAVDIRWPDGKVQSLGPIGRMRAGDTLTVTEARQQ
jgi:enediyne biosynthesis protein E4